MKKSFLLSFLLISTALSFSQITFKTEDFTKTMPKIKGIPVCDTTAFGVTVPLNEKITKYDKVVVSLLIRAKGTEDSFVEKDVSNFTSIFYYPKSVSFVDYAQGLKDLKIYLKVSPSLENRSLFTRKNFCPDQEDADIYTSYEYKVVVRGFEKSGTETYWSDYSESIKTRDLYEFIKNVYSSEVFSFSIGAEDQAYITARELRAKQFDERMATADKIDDMYNITVMTPLGEAQPRVGVYRAYIILRKELLNTEDYERLDKVDAKMLSIEKKFMVLGRKLSGQKDPDLIYEEIMKFPY